MSEVNSNIEWTDEAMMAFCQVYAGNTNSSRVPMQVSYKKYHKLKIHEKLETFKQDWSEYQRKLKFPFSEGDEYWVLGGDGVLRYSVWDDVAEEDHMEEPNRRYFTYEQGMDMARRNGILNDHHQLIGLLKAPTP